MTSDRSNPVVSQTSHFKFACINNVWVKSLHSPISPSHRKFKNKSSTAANAAMVSCGNRIKELQEVHKCDMEKILLECERQQIDMQETCNQKVMDMQKQIDRTHDDKRWYRTEAQELRTETQELQEQCDRWIESCNAREDRIEDLEQTNRELRSALRSSRNEAPSSTWNDQPKVWNESNHSQSSKEWHGYQDWSNSPDTWTTAPQDRREYNGVIWSTYMIIHV